MSKHVPRLYCDSPLTQGLRQRLDKETAHHLLNVLRLKPGAAVMLFDGRGGEFQGNLAASGKDWVEIEIGIHHAIQRESALRITLGQAISRGERMDYTIQKAVELGVQNIQPLDTERSLVRLDTERLNKKLRHWQEIACSAAEQSGRESVPRVHAVLPLSAWFAALGGNRSKLVLDPQATQGLTALSAASEVCLLAGPEGGLSDPEVLAAVNAGFTGIRLGPRILRTETAAVACLAALQTLWGDLG